MGIQYKKYGFTAILDDGSMKRIYVRVPDDAPMDCFWTMAIRECTGFTSPLQQLCLNEVVIETYDGYAVVK